MPVHEIVRMGHPVLREEGKILSKDEILSEEMQTLIADMWETMESASGMGLAAPQIAKSIQLAVIEVPETSTRYQVEEGSEKYIIFNPIFTPLTEEKIGIWEGCLSLPGLRGYVPRYKKVKVEFLNEKAEEKELILEDFLAIVFQHEIDHLFGKLFVDRMPDMSLLSFEKEYVDFHLAI